MLQEKVILQDILVLDKDIMKKYTDSWIESNCTKERSLLEKNLGATAKDQFCVFQSMFDRGYYPVENADEMKVKEAKQQMCEVSKSMPTSNAETEQPKAKKASKSKTN